MPTNEARRRPTISDVADRAEVSRQTVSNVLTHPHRVRPDTRDRVRAAIEELGYEASTTAQSLRSRRTGAIGFEVNTLGQPAHNDTLVPLLVELGLRASAHGQHVVPFGSTGPDPMLAGYQRMWATSLVDAFLIADTHHGDVRPPWLEANGVPFVSFGRVWDDPTFTRWVDVDGAAGLSLAVAHCREAGYDTVAFLGWPHGSVVGDDRRQGWADGCRAAGVRQGPEAVAVQDLDAARAAAAGLLAALPDGSAVVCVSDVLALGVHHELLRSGRQPGADIGVVGFDGSDGAATHRLTTVAHPYADIADSALRLLDDAFLGRPRPERGELLVPFVARSRSTTRGSGFP